MGSVASLLSRFGFALVDMKELNGKAANKKMVENTLGDKMCTEDSLIFVCGLSRINSDYIVKQGSKYGVFLLYETVNKFERF